MERLNGVDANILISVVAHPSDALGDAVSAMPPAWEDSYNRSGWYKTWGKGDLLLGRRPESSELPSRGGSE